MRYTHRKKPTNPCDTSILSFQKSPVTAGRPSAPIQRTERNTTRECTIRHTRPVLPRPPHYTRSVPTRAYRINSHFFGIPALNSGGLQQARWHHYLCPTIRPQFTVLGSAGRFDLPEPLVSLFGEVQTGEFGVHLDRLPVAGDSGFDGVVEGPQIGSFVAGLDFRIPFVRHASTSKDPDEL